MSASNEWFEYHLTPHGWELGSNKTDFGQTETKEPPVDRSLSVRIEEKMSSTFSKMDRSTTVVFRARDEQHVQALIDKFGETPS